MQPKKRNKLKKPSKKNYSQEAMKMARSMMSK